MEKGNSPVPIPAAPCLAPEGPRLRGLLPDPQATWQRRRAPFPATPSPTRIPEKAPWHSTCVLSHPPTQENGPSSFSEVATSKHGGSEPRPVPVLALPRDPLCPWASPVTSPRPRLFLGNTGVAWSTLAVVNAACALAVVMAEAAVLWGSITPHPVAGLASPPQVGHEVTLALRHRWCGGDLPRALACALRGSVGWIPRSRRPGKEGCLRFVGDSCQLWSAEARVRAGGLFSPVSARLAVWL